MEALSWLKQHDPISSRSRWLLLIFTPMAIAVVILSLRLNDAISTVNHQHAAITAQAVANESQRHVLTELCRTNEIILGLVRGTETLFEYQTGILPPPKPGSIRDQSHGLVPGKPLVNKDLVPYYLNALKIFIGWDAQLSQQTACDKITRP